MSIWHRQGNTGSEWSIKLHKHAYSMSALVTDVYSVRRKTIFFFLGPQADCLPRSKTYQPTVFRQEEVYFVSLDSFDKIRFFASNYKAVCYKSMSLTRRFDVLTRLRSPLAKTDKRKSEQF